MSTSVSGPKGVVDNDAKTGPKGEPMTPIPSATLVILCPISNADAQNKQSVEYATLMVQRSARAGGSFRSAVVFPGGLLDQADVHATASGAQSGNKSPSSSAGGLQSLTSETYLDALRLCAIRETFEETGLLLLPDDGAAGTPSYSRAVDPREAGMSDAEWTEARQNVSKDARLFPLLLERVRGKASPAPASIPLAPLKHHSNWVTPRTLVRPAKRFDTHFFITVLSTPDALGQTTLPTQVDAVGLDSPAASRMAVGLTADGSETTQLRLSTPKELLELAVRDEIIMFPPQYYILTDVQTSLSHRRQQNEQCRLSDFTPLYFGEQIAIEEDAAKTTTSPPAIKAISSVEPQGMPSEGLMIARSDLSSTGGKHGGGSDESNEADQIFVLPLTLPGDHLRPIVGQPSEPSRKHRNRVYVTPRSKGEGGGLIVHGAYRSNQPGLLDFKWGHIPDELEGEADDANEDAQSTRGGTISSKL